MIPTISSIPTTTPISQSTQPIPHINTNTLLTALNAVPAPMIPNINSANNFTTRPFNTNVATTFANNNLPNLPIIAPLMPQVQQPHMRIIRDGVVQQPMIPQYSEPIIKPVDNAGKRWTKEEDSQVMSLVISGIRLSEIGNRLGRSSHAIKMRVILLLSTRFQNEGVFSGQRPTDGTPEEICQRHQVTYDQVLEYNSTKGNALKPSRLPANNSTSNGLGIPNPGTLPVLAPLTLGPQIGVPAIQDSMQGSTLVNNSILTEIRDLLVQLNTKLDRLNNTPTNDNAPQ